MLIANVHLARSNASNNGVDTHRTSTKNAIFINKPTILPVLNSPFSIVLPSFPFFLSLFLNSNQSHDRSKPLHHSRSRSSPPLTLSPRERESGRGEIGRKRRNGSRPRGEPREKYAEERKRFVLELEAGSSFDLGPFLRVFLVFSDPPSFREILSILVFISPYAICRLARRCLLHARPTSRATRARKRVLSCRSLFHPARRAV